VKILLTTYPSGIERVYQAVLLRCVAGFQEEAVKILIPAYAEALYEFQSDIRQDAWPTDLKRAFSRLNLALGALVGDSVKKVPPVAEQVVVHSRNRWRVWAAQVVGVNIFRPKGEAAWLNPMVQSWTGENSRLITSIATQYLDKVAQRSQDMVRSGTSPLAFAAELQAVYDLTRSRAKLIARTEIAKLNGQITQARQQRLGIEVYTWATARDERVRDSHAVLEGKECRWDDPTVYRDSGDTEWTRRARIGAFEGHPGEDFQCRCVSYADIETTLDTLLGNAA